MSADFDKLMRAHRRDKTSRKRKRRPAATSAAAAAATPGTSSSSSSSSSTSTSITAKDGPPPTKSSRVVTSRDVVLEYSASFSNRNFETHQARITKADRSWTAPYQFTEDWHTRHVAYWSHHLRSRVGTPLHYLEIGCYEGLSTCWVSKVFQCSSSCCCFLFVEMSINMYVCVVMTMLTIFSLLFSFFFFPCFPCFPCSLFPISPSPSQTTKQTNNNKKIKNKDANTCVTK